jgi:hypothetical protein
LINIIFSQVSDNSLFGLQRDNLTLNIEIQNLRKDYKDLLAAFQRERLALHVVQQDIVT